MSAEAPITRESKILEAQSRIDELNQKFDMIIANSEQLRQIMGENYNTEYLNAGIALGMKKWDYLPSGLLNREYLHEDKSERQYILKGLELRYHVSDNPEATINIIMSSIKSDEAHTDCTIKILEKLKSDLELVSNDPAEEKDSNSAKTE